MSGSVRSQVEGAEIVDREALNGTVSDACPSVIEEIPMCDYCTDSRMHDSGSVHNVYINELCLCMIKCCI